MKLLNKVAVEAGVNKRVPYLEGETIFGTAKQKLNLPPGDDSDSHCHDWINYSIPILQKGISPSQAQGILNGTSGSNHSPNSIPKGKSSSECPKLVGLGTPQLQAAIESVIASLGYPILESACVDPT